MKSMIRNLPIPVDKRSITANKIQSTTCKPPDSIAPFAKIFCRIWIDVVLISDLAMKSMQNI